MIDLMTISNVGWGYGVGVCHFTSELTILQATHQLIVEDRMGHMFIPNPAPKTAGLAIVQSLGVPKFSHYAALGEPPRPEMGQRRFWMEVVGGGCVEEVVCVPILRLGELPRCLRQRPR